MKMTQSQNQQTNMHANTQETRTWQNTPASCLSSPSGQGPKSAGSRAHQHIHPHTPTQRVQDSRLGEDHLSRFFLVLLRK